MCGDGRDAFGKRGRHDADRKKADLDVYGSIVESVMKQMITKCWIVP